MSEHLDSEQLLALSLLGAHEGEVRSSASPADEAALRAARAHIARCTSCAARLRENQAVFALLDEQPSPPTISPALRARVLDRVGHGRQPWLPWTRLSVLLALTSSLLLAYFDGRGSDLRLADLAPDVGLHCLAFQGAFALIPFVVGMALSHAGKVKLEPLAFSAWSMGFAVVAQIALRTRCEAHDLSVHLFAVHFVGVLLAGLISGGLGRMLQPARLRG